MEIEVFWIGTAVLGLVSGICWSLSSMMKEDNPNPLREQDIYVLIPAARYGRMGRKHFKYRKTLDETEAASAYIREFFRGNT